MRYYRYLYVSEEIEQKKKKILRNLKQGRYRPGLHLILLSDLGSNQLEIISSIYFFQSVYARKECLVVGIAGNYEEALELVEKISQEVYDNTGEMMIRDYIKKREREG